MGNYVTFSVVSDGQPLPGFAPEQVVSGLAQLLKIAPEKAQALAAGKRVLKKGLNQQQAELYKQKLEGIGMRIVLERNDPQQFKPSMALELEPIEGEAAAAAVQPPAPPAASEPARITCPKCEHEQTKAEQCQQCGIYFHKLQETASPVMGMAEVESPVQEDELEVSEDAEPGSLQPKALAAAAVAALLGALVWKFIAVAFEYELGIVAWGIGGAVGFAAAMAGSRGQLAGIACGVLVVVSMMGGRYMAVESFKDQAVEMMLEVQNQGIDVMVPLFEEELEDARLYASEVSDEASLRTFMIDRSYTEALDESQVSQEEIDWFNEFTRPRLEQIASDPPSFDEWQAGAFAEVEEISTMSLIMEDFGVMHILFLILGVGTAFRLGSGGITD